MPREPEKHLLEEYDEDEKIAYLSILSSMCYADKEFDDREKRHLDLLLERFNISDAGKAQVYSSIFDFSSEDVLATIDIIQAITNSELKYTLISDLCLCALADSQFSDKEYRYILGIGEVLGITQEQIDAIRSIQESLANIENIPPNSERVKNLVKDTVSKLAAVGVPVGAIAASGSVFGLSAAGITSGLATLGAVVGGGMVAGVVIVVPTIAAASVYGVKKIFDVVWKNSENPDNTNYSRERGNE